MKRIWKMFKMLSNACAPEKFQQNIKMTWISSSNILYRNIPNLYSNYTSLLDGKNVGRSVQNMATKKHLSQMFMSTVTFQNKFLVILFTKFKLLIPS